jgi:hypothetical protein
MKQNSVLETSIHATKKLHVALENRRSITLFTKTPCILA